MNDVLARIHNVDYRAVGLGDYGREGQYIQRQVARWSSQYDLARTEHIEAMEALKQWLPANIPPGDETRINHGDYRLGNTIVHPTEPRIVAVLDWELSTLGHPLADLGYNCMMYHFGEGFGASGGYAGLDLKAFGIPTEPEYLAAYAAAPAARRSRPGTSTSPSRCSASPPSCRASTRRGRLTDGQGRTVDFKNTRARHDQQRRRPTHAVAGQSRPIPDIKDRLGGRPASRTSARSS